MKGERIEIRVSLQQKKRWLDICKNGKADSLTNLIIDSVENRVLESERKGVLNLMEVQSNYFAKVENNLNQIAKFVNAKKDINQKDLKEFLKMQKEIGLQKTEQNKLFSKILKELYRS